MKKQLYFLFTVLLSVSGFAQLSQGWKGYFSYTEIKDLAQGTNRVVAASENALFSQDAISHLLRTTTTLNGLSGQTISTVYYSQGLNRTIIGYENGLITVVNSDGSIVKVVDIINKQLPPNIKKVNHFMEHEGILYISCDFGICQYNLSTLQFGDTYFIGTATAEIVVNQTAVYNGYIYAATRDFGIKRAQLSNPNLIDATQWSEMTPGSWAAAVSFQDQLIVCNASGQLQRFNGTSFVSFGQLAGGQPLDLRAVGDYLIGTTMQKVTVYNASLAVVSQIFNYMIPDVITDFTCATMVGESVYIGTLKHGVFRTELSNPSEFENITPAGPVRNNIFSINTETPDLWIAYGGYPSNYNPNPLQYYGLSKFNAEGWKHLDYDEVHVPGKDANNLVRITFNPSNQSQFYVSSYHSGLLKFENEELVMQYDHTNSPNGLNLFDPGYFSIRVEQSAFDRNGNLWMTSGLLNNGMKVLRANGSWQSYDVTSIIGSPFDDRWGRMVVDKNNVKWFVSFANGVVAFSENGPVWKKITMGADQGNLPFTDTRALAIDKRNQLWIGTTRGIRVLPSVDSFSGEDQMRTNPIIILDEDGVAQELLYEQFVSDIAVDGANNKWIGTADSGIFLVSPNGQQTIHHFTINNSPLPSNVINDIEINGKTGEVYIATDKGMVSFGGTATNAEENLNNVIVYPNPVRPEYAGTVKITNLLNRANIKVTDIAGNLVHEAVSEGGTIEWDTTAFGKYRVASGVYMIFISSEDGMQTKVKKVMIVR